VHHGNNANRGTNNARQGASVDAAQHAGKHRIIGMSALSYGLCHHGSASYGPA